MQKDKNASIFCLTFFRKENKVVFILTKNYVGDVEKNEGSL